MNQHYDELARYPYELSKDEREIVLNNLTNEDINYLVSQKIEPSQFLPYIEIKDFVLENTLWYDLAYQTQKPKHIDDDEAIKEYIVSFVNRYRNNLEYNELEAMLSNYSYNVLTRFFDEKDYYVNDAKLIADPTNPYLVIKNKETIYTYVPSDLVSINDLPHDSIVPNSNDITIKKNVVKPLKELLTAAKEINQKKYGGLKVIAGFISYEDQVSLYEEAQNIYGDSVLEYWDYPGQSEFQLGYTVRLLPEGATTEFDQNEDDEATDKEAEEENEKLMEEMRNQEIWLKDNAYKYGFIIRYPKQKEEVTGKKYQPFTLRYVGEEVAKKLHDLDVAIDEVDVQSLVE